MEAPASRCHAPNRATLMGHAGAQGTATLVLPAVPLPTPRSAGTGLPWALCGPAHSPSPPAAAPYSRGPAVPAAPCPPERPGPAGRGGCGGREAGRHGRTGPANPTLSVPLFLVSDSKAAAVFPPGGSQATSVGPPGLRPQPGPALHGGGRKAWTRGRDAGTGAQGRGWGRRPGREAGRGQRHVPAGCLPLLPASHSLLVPQTPYPSQPLALPRRVSPAPPLLRSPPRPPPGAAAPLSSHGEGALHAHRPTGPLALPAPSRSLWSPAPSCFRFRGAPSLRGAVDKMVSAGGSGFGSICCHPPRQWLVPPARGAGRCGGCSAGG